MNVYQTAFIDATADYSTMTVATLRKMASGKVKNAGRLPKSALVAELAKLYAMESEKTTEKPAKARKPKTQPKTQAKSAPAATDHETAPKTDKDGKPFKSTKAPKIGRKMCEVCSKRPIDRKTQGRDSTMCEPCFEYAGWENTHSDNGHEGQGDLPTAPKELLSEMAECPVCQGNDPANDVVKTKANGSKPGRVVSKPAKTEKGQSKAEKFAADAKELGWKPRIEKDGKGLEIVTATHVNTGEWIKIQWQDNRCLNTGTTHKRPNGKVVHLRNASAARKALDA